MEAKTAIRIRELIQKMAKLQEITESEREEIQNIYNTIDGDTDLIQSFKSLYDKMIQMERVDQIVEMGDFSDESVDFLVDWVMDVKKELEAE